MRKSMILAAIGLSLSLSTTAHAWGQLGHRVVGQIAADNVDGRTAANIALILDHGETLAEAATWPDEQKSDPDEYWQKTSYPWHWVTVPEGKTYDEVGAPPEGDAYSALRRFTATLRDPDATREDKALALRFVVHIVGDLHQPLHNGNGTDRGGNQFKIEWFGEETNLHSLWDTALLEGNGLSYTEYADSLERHMTNQQKIAWWDARPETWMAESIALRDRIYPPADATSIGYSYQWTWRPVAERRLAQGGVRLAAYLDWVFGAEPTG
ncbi:S1/P1 nuclease [Croceicoccus sediminis]|uniref:S1/P1 nuclease n=1 Tax=Croceicoccus sediminis TaxID=2571150 RepID=UPI001182438D|nr:S1/P1 nuclease [Croceicoccus sediminis]